MKKRLLWGFAGSALLTSTTALASVHTVPISSLQPATHLSKPQLSDVGGKLIFSDSPETFSSQGAFYRDTATGEFRVFWRHQNESGQPITVAVAITNNSKQPIALFSEGQGVGTNYYPDVAGQDALAGFMSTHDDKEFVTFLSPGSSYYVTSNTPQDDTTSGIAQFVAMAPEREQPATVTVTTLSYQNQPDDPAVVPIQSPDDHVRGSFPHFDRTGTIFYDTKLGNAYIELSSAPSGEWSDSLPGEYESGVDVVDRNAPVVDDGNYGVLYNLRVAVENGSNQPRDVLVYDNPAGGAGHYVMMWNGQMSQSDYLDYTQAWQFAEFKIAASRNDTSSGKGRSDGFNVSSNESEYSLQTSLPGGAAGPSVIYFVSANNNS